MNITKNDIRKFPAGTAEHVVMHARWQKSRGRNPSMHFLNITNPLKALSWALSMAYFPETGSYLDGRIPQNYKCEECGAHGFKLWRMYQSFIPHLRCATCAAKNQDKDITSIGKDGTYQTKGKIYPKSDQIGWYMPAIPSEEGGSYWGYTSVPEPGIRWWRNLPTLAKPIT